MNELKFTHLRTTSALSIDKGTLNVKDIIKLAKNNNQQHVAITDTGKTIGVVQQYIQAKKEGLKPIIGVEVFVEPDVTEKNGNDGHKVLLIARNNDGYQNLLHLISKSNLENLVNDVAYVKESWLQESNKGLICLSGSFKESFFAQKALDILSEDNEQEAELKKQTLLAKIDFYKKTFNNHFYFEIQRYGLDKEDDVILYFLELSNTTQTPVVATHPIEFEKPEDFIANEIRASNYHKKTLYDVNRDYFSSKEQYFLSTEEMYKRFEGLEFALQNAFELAENCNVEIELYHNYLPPFPVPKEELTSYKANVNSQIQGKGSVNSNSSSSNDNVVNNENNKEEHQNEKEYLEKLTYERFEEKFKILYPNKKDYDENKPLYLERLREELDVIIGMDFAGYFLIVQDFINWSKQNGVAIGPGRGSGGGSLVAYSLGITNVDPIKYNLLFERFLNKERVSMPDFDIDFSKDLRYKTYEYVKEKYGEDVVTGIGTVMNSKPKALLKIVQKNLDLPLPPLLALNKTITFEQANKYTLEQIYEENADFRDMVDNDSTCNQIYTLASKMSTLPVALGQHAAGVIITSKPVEQFSALTRSKENEVVTLIDKNDAEYVGLVKFDFLGLETLDVIAECVEEVKRDKGISIDIENIDLDDPKAIEIISSGNSTGVFQFDKVGVQRFSQKLKPTNFEDAVALTALNRPGPLSSGMMESFIARKNGLEKVYFPDKDYNHPCLEPILQNTYGLIVYQEQIMQIAQAMAGYTFGQADILRRAMGKKKPEEMAQQREVFKQGALKNGISEDLSMKIFDIVEKFAGYGFNKSHSVAYTVISMQTAYLKAYHPEHFLAVLLNHQNDDKGKLKVIQDIVKNNIEILPPHVNYSKQICKVEESQGKLGVRYGLSNIKRIGNTDLNIILDEREKNGLYKSFIDFYERNAHYLYNKKVLTEQLIKCGAFDDLPLTNDGVLTNKNELLTNLEHLNKEVKKLLTSKTKGRRTNLLARFEENDEQNKTIQVDLENWKKLPEPTLLEETKLEMVSLGLNIRFDPFSGFIDKFNGLKAFNTVADIQNVDPNNYQACQDFPVACLVTDIRSVRGGKIISVIGEGFRTENLNNIVETSDEEIEQIDDNDNDNSEFLKNENDYRINSFYIKDELYNISKNKIKEGAFLVLKGNIAKAKKGFDGNSFFPNEIYSESEVEEMLLERIHVLIDPNNAKKLEQIIENHKGKIPIMVHIPSKKGQYFSAELDKKHFINGSKECLDDLRSLFLKECLKFDFKDKIILNSKNQSSLRYK